MTTLRLRYEHGQLIPLEEIPGLSEGDEIEVEWKSTTTASETIDDILARTAGLWIDSEKIEVILDWPTYD
ncbi:MAG: hypothetical protein BroJett018_44150 [Chloroflexota bacterium]|nr:DUF104 domain-containing protein [Chloroflexota bacterium]NOG65233.1 DUF104 domain-containing protein [Chloroflexota bacterium]GIK66621.1 MAG: hypothetical protein BroJett018_44150 [Chloroflexota bacterium]